MMLFWRGQSSLRFGNWAEAASATPAREIVAALYEQVQACINS